VSDLEVFKTNVRRGIQYLLPQAKANLMTLDSFKTEVELYLKTGKKNQERIYEFPPYRMLLSFSILPKGGPLLIASGSAPGRTGNGVLLSSEESEAFIDVVKNAFPEYKISPMEAGLSAAFKVLGLPKEGGNDEQQ
jgi:hypothetical protein